MSLSQMMERFQKELELDKEIPQDDMGNYMVSMDEDIVMYINDLNPGIELQCEVAECPTEALEAFLTDMMLANLFGQGTEGAVLGLNDEGDALTLSQEIDYNVDYERFRDHIEDFMNAVDFWRSEALHHKAA